MSFRITGLSPGPFQHLFGLSDQELAKHGAKRYVADTKPGYPDRIEVRDVEPGETVMPHASTGVRRHTLPRAGHQLRLCSLWLVGSRRSEPALHRDELVFSDRH
jgi:hypothetical protein